MIFLILSAVLLSISAPLSMALDHIAIGVGLLGLIVIFYNKKVRLYGFDAEVLSVSAIGLISSIFSGNIINSLINSHYLWHFLPYFITSRIKNDRIKVILNILVFSIIIASFGVIIQATTGINPKHILDNINSAHINSYTIRASGFFNNALTTSGIMAPSALLFLSLMLVGKKNKIKVLYFLTFILSSIALIFTMSRSYWLGFGVALLLLPIIYRKKISFILLITAVIMSLFSYAYIKPIHNRINTAIYFHHNESAMNRIALWKGGIKLFKGESIARKLIGCGSGQVGKNIKPYIIKSSKEVFGKNTNVKSHIFSALHNEYLQILIKWGVVGLIIWLYLWIYVLFKNIKYINNTNDEFKKAVVIGLTLGFISFLIGGFFEHNVGDAEVIIFIMYLLGINQNIVGGEKNEVLS